MLFRSLFVDNEFGGTGRVTLHSGEAEVVACLLSTTWMETYSRVFPPTVGPLVSKDKGDAEWQELEMMDIRKAESRDVRQEIKNALDDFEAVTNGQKMDRFDEDQQHEELKKILMNYQKGQDAGNNTISADDDLSTAFGKASIVLYEKRMCIICAQMNLVCGAQQYRNYTVRASVSIQLVIIPNKVSSAEMISVSKPPSCCRVMLL